MGTTAYTGPLITFGQAVQASSAITAPADYNPQAAPNLWYQGDGVLDARWAYTYEPGSGATNTTYGWFGTTWMPTIDQVPTVISTNSVAQQQVPTAAAALTLTASNTNNVTISQTITDPVTGASVTGLRAIDGVMAVVTFGSDTSVSMWSPATSVARCITITSISTTNDGGMVWSIAGRDLYGYKITESVPGSTVGATVTSRKAFKYVTGVTPVNSTGTMASTGVIVGVSDTFGLPVLAPRAQYVTSWMDNTTLSSSYVTAGASATATSTTADVRGTYASSVASDGTKRLVIFQTPSVATIGAANGAGMTGVQQYSSV